jgi:hypothetical protein
MKISIHGKPQQFISIQHFRDMYYLPPEFGVDLLETKDFTTWMQMDDAAEDLHQLFQTMIQAVPASMPSRGWQALRMELQVLLHRRLRALNPKIGLRMEEIGLAVAGFGEVLQTYIYAVLQAQLYGEALPAFNQVYRDWLHSTVNVSPIIYVYWYRGEKWQIQPIRHIYGVLGLVIRINEQIHHVEDRSLSCDAEGFMEKLTRETSARILRGMSMKASSGRTVAQYSH